MVERKVLRTIYGADCVDGEWKTRYKLYSLYKDAQITKKYDNNVLGYVVRMKMIA